MGLSLWLVPSDQNAKPLRDIIQHLAATHDSPSFLPHVTLLSLPQSSPYSTAEVLELIPQEVPPLTLTFDALEVGETFYQSVLIAIKQSTDLMKLASEIRAIFGETNPDYFPHLSLYYGEGPRAQIVDELRESGDIVDVQDRGTIVRGTDKVIIDRIVLVDTSGPPATWELLGETG